MIAAAAEGAATAANRGWTGFGRSGIENPTVRCSASAETHFQSGCIGLGRGAPCGEKPLLQDDGVQVLVRDNNVDQALKALKKKMQREGIFREMKLRGHYEKPSEKRAREAAEAGAAPASWPARSCNAKACCR